MQSKKRGRLFWLGISTAVFVLLVSVLAYHIFRPDPRYQKEYDMKVALMDVVAEAFPLIRDDLMFYRMLILKDH